MSKPVNGVHGSHWIRYGIAGDQKYLVGDFADTFDQLVVNANILAHMPSALSQFLTQTSKKPFVVDPQTHAFQHSLDLLLSSSKKSKGQLKRSWKGLVDAYGDPLSKILRAGSPRTIRPEDLSDQQTLDEFCARVLRFQKDTVELTVESGPDSEYIKYIASETGENLAKVPPAILIAPYFCINGPLQDEWLEVTAQCAKSSRKWVDQNASDIPLAIEVVVSKEVIGDESYSEALCDRLNAENPDLFLIWIDSFSEQKASKNFLESYLKFITHLSKNGKPVVNLYGGFFSIAQMKVGELQGKLLGVCHGLEYGETRPVVPLGGGVPVARFYSNALHHRMPRLIALEEVRALGGFASVEAFHKEVCGCKQCLEIITSNPEKEFLLYIKAQSKMINYSGRYRRMEYPTSEAADFCTRHYLWCKHSEYNSTQAVGDLKTSLNDASTKLVETVGVDYSAHAKVWSVLL